MPEGKTVPLTDKINEVGILHNRMGLSVYNPAKTETQPLSGLVGSLHGHELSGNGSPGTSVAVAKQIITGSGGGSLSHLTFPALIINIFLVSCGLMSSQVTAMGMAFKSM